MSFEQRRDVAPGTPLMNQQKPFDLLADRAENEIAPDFIVSNDQGGERTGKICKYPNQTTHFYVDDPLNHAIYLLAIVN